MWANRIPQNFIAYASFLIEIYVKMRNGSGLYDKI